MNWRVRRRFWPQMWANYCCHETRCPYISSACQHNLTGVSRPSGNARESRIVFILSCFGQVPSDINQEEQGSSLFPWHGEARSTPFNLFCWAQLSAGTFGGWTIVVTKQLDNLFGQPCQEVSCSLWMGYIMWGWVWDGVLNSRQMHDCPNRKREEVYIFTFPHYLIRGWKAKFSGFPSQKGESEA